MLRDEDCLEWTPELVARFWDGIARSRLVELAFSRTGGVRCW